MLTDDDGREIELAVLGSFFRWFDELKDKRLLVSRDDFSTEERRKIFDVIAAAPVNYDITMLAADVPREARDEAWEAANGTISIHFFGEYISRLLQMSQARRLKEKVFALSMGEDITVADVQSIVDGEAGRNRLLSCSDKAVQNIEAFAANVGKPQPRVMTGFTSVDKVICGLRVPSVSIIGAAPSTGKTALALNIATKQDKPVIFFSLEMSASMIFERIASDKLSVNYQAFSSQSLTETQAKQSGDYVKGLSKKLFVFDDIFNVEQQAAIINNLKPSLVVVDYIQKVRTSGRPTDRRIEIEYISGTYKQLALYNNCHIMLLSQLKRGDGSKPSMFDLKESGALEADGDYVMLLNRPYVTDKTQDKTEAVLLIDKNKFGGTGKVDLRFAGEYQRFTTVDARFDSPTPRKSTRRDSKHRDDEPDDGGQKDLISDLPF